MGHTVVEMAIVLVVTTVLCAGQLVTLAAHEVIVISVVEKIVDVEYDTMDGDVIVETGALDDLGVLVSTGEVLTLVTGEVWILVTGEVWILVTGDVLMLVAGEVWMLVTDEVSTLPEATLTWVAVTGHTVVETAIVLVVTTVLCAGQFVTVAAHEVIVISVVE